MIGHTKNAVTAGIAAALLLLAACQQPVQVTATETASRGPEYRIDTYDLTGGSVPDMSELVTGSLTFLQEANLTDQGSIEFEKGILVGIPGAGMGDGSRTAFSVAPDKSGLFQVCTYPDSTEYVLPSVDFSEDKGILIRHNTDSDLEDPDWCEYQGLSLSRMDYRRQVMNGAEMFGVSVSSFLTEGETAYGPENLTKPGLNKTPWAVAAKDVPLAGFTISVNDRYSVDLPNQNGISISDLVISNGYVSIDKPQLYSKNSRIKKIHVTSPHGYLDDYYLLKDVPNPQVIHLDYPVDVVTVSVEEVYPGSAYGDLCVNFVLPCVSQGAEDPSYRKESETQPNVRVIATAGEDTGPGFYKNGAWFPLPLTDDFYTENDSNYNYSIAAVAVAGTDVYITGTRRHECGYWKNGVWHKLASSGQGSASPKDVFLIDGEVYVTGFFGDKDDVEETGYWKNDEWHMTPLPVGYLRFTMGKACVDPVTRNWYMGGTYTTSKGVSKAGYWSWNTKEWVELEPYHDSEDLYLTGLAARDGTVYATANYQEGENTTAGLWKDGTWVAIDRENKSEGDAATAVVLSYGDVYVAGARTVNGKITPGYWKNGAWTYMKLPSGTDHLWPTGIAVYDDDVYVAAYSWDVKGYWKNDVWTGLEGTGNYPLDISAN